MSDLSSNNYVFSRAGENDTGITVNIGANVTRIPAYLFYPSYSSYSPNIVSVNFEENSQCTEIGDYAFRDCISLTNITIPENVISIGNGAFWDCTGLTEINFNATNMSDLSSGNYVFYNAGKNATGIAVNIGANVTRIPAYLFNPYSSTTSPNIISVDFAKGSQCTEIGDYAFRDCSSLTSITIPEGVTSIGQYAFYNCTGLLEINYNATNVTDLSDSNYVFANAGNSSTGVAVNIGANVAQIPAYLFCPNRTDSSYSPNIISINFAEDSQCTEIGSYAFYNCTGLTEINFNATNMSDLSSTNYVFAYAGEDSSGIVVNIGANVTRIPAYLFDPYSSSSYSSNIISVNFQEGSQCTEIGTCAFSNCSSLTNITIPENVTSIGDGAFYNCTELTEINFNATNMSDLSSGDNVFYNAGNNSTGIVVNIGANVTRIPAYLFCPDNSYYSPNIVSVNFAENNQCTEIGNFAFSGCSSLTSIAIPEKVTSIGTSAFSGCSSLTDVYYDGDINDWVSISFGGYYANPLSYGANLYLNGDTTTPVTEINIDIATSIGAYAFYGLDTLTKVTIGNQVTSVGSSAFSDCSNLTSITIPSSVTSIGRYAFSDCSRLTNITIPSSVTSIGDYAFSNCYSLVEVINLSSLTFNVGDYGTSTGNNPILEIIVDEANSKLVTINGNIYKDYNGERYFIKNIDGSSEINIDSSATQIYQYAFYERSDITSVTIPSSVTSIGSSAFRGCSSLTSITIPENVTSIGERAFYGCSSLQYNSYEGGLYLGNQENPYMVLVDTEATDMTEFTIHSDCKIICPYVFSSCSSLTSITIPSGVTSIGAWAFSSCSSLTSVTFENTEGWWVSTSNTATSGTRMTVTDPARNASYLKSVYIEYYWKRIA